MDNRRPDMFPVLFFGMTGRFSLLVLEALLAASTNVCAVVISTEGGPAVASLRPPPPAPIPLRSGGQARTVVALAWEQGIPAFAANRLRSTEARALLEELRPAVACVACFAQKIPPALLAIPRHGFLNVHPALLPQRRGPSPLFWVLRDGQGAGVTVHQMDADLDTGPIVAQQPLALPHGVSGPEAERLCATLGGQLLVAALSDLRQGTLRPRPQPPEGTHAPTPTPDDFRLDVGWSAERAFAFMRGTAEWGRPYPLTSGGTPVVLTHALRYDPAAHLDAPFHIDGDTITVQFTPGILVAHGRVRRMV